MKEKLLNYIESAMNYENAEEETKKGWIFGAVDFAACEGLITSEEYTDLLKKYHLI